MTQPTLQMPLTPDPLPSVAGYRLQGLAGAGGMARVYRAVEEGLERPVAIKVLRAHGPDPGVERQRFEREAQVVATLQHPNIVPIYRITRTREGDPCIVMPWLAGSLADRVLPLPEPQAREVLAALLDALGHAHAQSIVHRDLKPDNVLFDAGGRPLLADFGVALRLGGDARLTGEGLAVGSARYMSPEQALGRELDGRSDLYAVGVMAWEILIGTPPFPASDAIAAALAHVEAPIPRLPAGLAHWQAWMDQALAKQPSERYPDAAAMRAALPSTAGAWDMVATGPATTTPQRARSRGGLLLGALGVVGLAGLLGWWLTQAPAPTPLDPEASTPAASRTVTPVAESPAARFPRWRDTPDSPWMLSFPADLGGAPRALSQSEITQAEFERYLRASGRPASACARAPTDPPVPPEHPATCVSHADARAYAEWLSGQTGRRYRLPSVAEWRALTVPLRNTPPSCTSAWLSLADCARATPAASDSGQGLGAGWFGLIGNVREWTDDCAWKVERRNVLGHGLRNTGRWLQGKDPAPRETRTCVGRRVVGSGHASTQPWPAAVTLQELDTRTDVGFRLVREGEPPAAP